MVTVWGVVASTDVWRVVKDTIDDPSIDIGWVSFSPREALAFLGEGGVDALLVESRGDLLTEALVEAADSFGIGLAALITGAAGDQHANRLGVNWRVRTPSDLSSFPVSDPSPPDLSPPHGSPSGIVVAVWGPVGSPGRTTISAALASLLAKRGVSTLLIDGDQRSGAVAPALGLLDEVPGFVASCRLADRGHITSDDLHRLAHRYDAGGGALDVLTGVSATRTYPEVTPDTVNQVIDACRQVWEVIVVDTGSDLAPSSHSPRPSEVVATTLVDAADEVIALCGATPVGVARFARAYPDVLERRGTKPLTAVLNGVDVSRRAVRDESTLREALRRFAGVANPVMVPRDSDTCRAADMSGVSISDAAPKSPAVKAVGVVAEKVSKRVEAVRRRAGHSPMAETAPVVRSKKAPLSTDRSLLARLRVLWREGLALR
jgi:MinD-like ATPase involved in chromosome partitioning or flagellar assembly